MCPRNPFNGFPSISQHHYFCYVAEWISLKPLFETLDHTLSYLKRGEALQFYYLRLKSVLVRAVKLISVWISSSAFQKPFFTVCLLTLRHEFSDRERTNSPS